MYQMRINEWVKEWKKKGSSAKMKWIFPKINLIWENVRMEMAKFDSAATTFVFEMPLSLWKKRLGLVVRLALYALNRNTLIFSTSAQTFSLRNCLIWMSNQVIMKTVVSVFVSVAYSVIFMICSMFFSIFIQIETLTFQNYQSLHFFGQPNKYTYNTINLI